MKAKMFRMARNACFNVFLLAVLAFNAAALFAEGPQLSGVFDSTVTYTNGLGDAPAHFWGIEEYANLRLRVDAGEKAVFYSAFNLVVLAGNYLETAAALGGLTQDSPLASSPIIAGENYAAGMELERLYFRINGDFFDTEAGLLRVAFGYGQVWGSSDFLNPRNPLFPNARLRGVLGATLSFYPDNSMRLMFFGAAPKNPFAAGAGGFLPGVSLDKHWDRASLQALYAYETPLPESKLGILRFGLSLKADLGLGLVADALYTLNLEEADTFGTIDSLEGLSAGAGFDYSLFSGKLYLLAEYLFNGNASSTALGGGGSWANRHYLYGNLLFRFSDFSSLSLAALLCFDDLSFSPFATFTCELFQGFSLDLTARVPLDQKTLRGGAAGELGPIPPNLDGSAGTTGARFTVSAGARLRF